MNLFVAVFFWVGLATLILRLLIIGCRTYPVQVTETLGLDLTRIIETGFFVVWAGILLFGSK